MPCIGTYFRFYMQIPVEKNTKHLHIEFIVTSHNSVQSQTQKIFLGVKLYNKFKILCNNDLARASSPSSPAQLKTWVDPWNIWLADFRMCSWPCLTLLSLSIRSNCKLFLENYRSAESGASRIPLLLFNCSCKAVEGLGTI